MNNVKAPIVPVHLLMSVFITNKSLQGIVKPVVNSLSNSRLDEFLSTVHSMSNLSFISCDFYLEFDKVYENYRPLVLKWLKELYPSARFYNYRLSSFIEWQMAEKNLPKNVKLVMLQTNFDHPYIAERPESFSEFCSQIDALSNRAIGNITHWPEAISSIMNPWRKYKNNYKSRSVFTDECEGVIGTCLVTKQLFSEWWENDFTQGAKIIRPDNPFGPSVRFLAAKSLTPKIELFRHMEGYGHVFIKSPWAQGFRPCCSIKHGSIIHTDWIRGNPKLKPKKFTELVDLPKVPYNSYTANETTVTNLILVASSHRISFRMLKNLKQHYILSNANLSNRILLNILKNRYFFIKIPGFITNQIIGGLINCVFLIISSDKKISVTLNYLSIIYSFGWVRGTIIYVWIKFEKLLKILVPLKLKKTIKKIVLS
jgi:hypothetical protein